MTTAEQLQPLVAAWLPNQRWFPGKGRDAAFTVERLAELQAEPEVAIWVVRAEFGDGDSETYQLPLTARSEAVASLEHVQIGTVDTEDGPRWIYDALHDKDVTRVWLFGMRDAVKTDDGSGASVRFVRYADDPDEIPVNENSLVLTGEQSNTSMVFGDIAIMKVFRRLQPGINPDIEVGAALTKLGARHVPKLLGAAEADVRGQPCSLAMLQEFLKTGTDGWELAKISVRDLMAEADLHAAEAGGDFAAEAHRLGLAVAETHADLATAFGTATMTSQQLRTRADAMQARLARASAIVPDLEKVAEPLNAIFAALGQLSDPVETQRIHGDLHLGQVLRTVYRWVLIDFEGEPMAAIESRREMDSTLRDVAGMLRSFDYAGYHRVVDLGNDPQLTYRAHEWSERNSNAFCEGYAEGAGADPRDQDVLLRAFEADKAVYEAVYEARNRPSWLAIPLASLNRLATDGGSR